MSVDTRNKRAACINVGLPFGRIAPNPDGSLNPVTDRQQLALSYPLASVVEITFNPIWAAGSTRTMGITMEPD